MDAAELSPEPALATLWLATFEGQLQRKLSDDTLSIPTLADEFNMSESTLLRQLKRLAGLSSIQYLQEIRLDRARHLLENRSHNSVAKVAAGVGFNDTRSFSRSLSSGSANYHQNS